MTVDVLVILGLLGVNALYVAAEFAAISARRTRVRQLAEAGSRRARWLRVVQDDPVRLDRYVAACQVGITLSSLVLGAYGQIAFTPTLADGLERWWGLDRGSALGSAATAVLLVLTSLQVVLAELVPKSVALQFPVQVAVQTAVPMRWSLAALRPFIDLLNGSGLLVLRAAGAQGETHRHIHSPDEISLLIAESREGGMLSRDEQARLERALRLSALPVRRLMVPRPDIVAVEARATMREVQRVLAGCPFTRLPVYDEQLDDVIGLVHARDVARHLVADPPRDLTAREAMRPVAFVPESIRGDLLLPELRRQRCEQAIVMDEHGGTAGLITVDDVLAEVLGEGIGADEETTPTPLADGRLRLPGRMRVDEAHEWIGVLWTGDSDTVGGIVAEVLGHIGRPGERCEIGGVEVEVEEADARAIRSLVVRPRPAADDAP